MPIIAHSLFEAMQVIIGSVHAFTEYAVEGLAANREKAEGWLARNAIVVTALNPIIGYAQGAQLVKEALKRDVAIREVAVEKAKAGLLKHRDNDVPVSVEEIEGALDDMRRLTESGIARQVIPVEAGQAGGEPARRIRSVAGGRMQTKTIIKASSLCR